jgi:hypothetical protein
MSTVGPTTKRGRALVAAAGRSVTSSDLDFWPYHICDKRTSVASVQNLTFQIGVLLSTVVLYCVHIT